MKHDWPESCGRNARYWPPKQKTVLCYSLWRLQTCPNTYVPCNRIYKGADHHCVSLLNVKLPWGLALLRPQMISGLVQNFAGTELVSLQDRWTQRPQSVFKSCTFCSYTYFAPAFFNKSRSASLPGCAFYSIWPLSSQSFGPSHPVWYLWQWWERLKCSSDKQQAALCSSGSSSVIIPLQHSHKDKFISMV